MRAAAPLLLVLGLAAAGCGSEYEVSLLLRSDPPVEPELTTDRVVLTEGIAIGVLARAVDDGELDEDADPIELVSSDTGIVDVRPGLEENEFVLIGRRVGRATIEARVGDEPAAPIDVIVEVDGP